MNFVTKKRIKELLKGVQGTVVQGYLTPNAMCFVAKFSFCTVRYGKWLFIAKRPEYMPPDKACKQIKKYLEQNAMANLALSAN